MAKLQHKLIFTLGLGQLLAWGSSFYLVAIVGPAMATSVGLPTLAVYAMFSASLLASAALGPFAGQRVDHNGGRRVLMLSNGLFATAHLVLATAHTPLMLLLGWLMMGIAMPFGLYDAAFATVVRHLGTQARSGIVGITLVAGFASSVSWPLTHHVQAAYGWQSACLMWAALHLSIGLGLHTWLLPKDHLLPTQAANGPATVQGAAPPRQQLVLLAVIFACSGCVFAALAAHLPRLLQTAGCTANAAIAAAAWVGVAQVLGRVLEASWLKRLHPLISALIATGLHPVAALLLWGYGAPLAAVFTALHGLGVGLMTIVKGTLPLALFGAAGFGKRAGLLEAPSKLLQAAAPIVFSLWLDHYGHNVLLMTFAITLTAFLGVCWLQTMPQLRPGPSQPMAATDQG